jgi:tetratricopeptide (TPR) repeat protein
MTWALILCLLLAQTPPSAEMQALQSAREAELRGDPAAAVEIGKQALLANPKSVELLKTVGRLLLSDPRRSAQARDPLTKAVALAPGDGEAHYYLSRWACLHNMDAQCITEARHSLRLAPGNLQAELQLNTLIGLASEKTGDAAGADAAFRRSLAANQKLGLPDPLSVYQYVSFLLKRAKDEEAQTIVTTLIQKAPRFGPAYLERAKYLAKKGQSEEAVHLAEQSLTLAEMQKEQLRAAHMLLARSYFQLGKEDEASKHQAWIEEHLN